ncbi:division/cell wall cluster transcriptional repressor MraZ [Peptoniphilus raoultii]|uniref:division/cell wall cluster transcriptional repressor MraZ n=1 Tax=Peptoniphilus raoultii TaxID=1776387 RepID=UPI0008DA6086|nr:division/cell wall cluster transcriptional repressor MraZ [Peptoniphilus raoultii]
MLIGEYYHNLDPKGRITIPSKFREDLTDFVMTKGLDNCLFLYPKNEWIKIENKLKELPMTNKAVRSFVRTFFSGATSSTIDKQGRVIIPQNLRDYAEIKDSSVIIGLSNRAEIWAEENWEKYNNEEGLSYEELAEKMSELGI